MKIQFAATLTDLRGNPATETVRPGFLSEVHRLLREQLQKIGCGADLLTAFDQLASETKTITVGDVVCSALMHGELRDPKKLVERLDLVRKIQAAEKTMTPIEFADVSDLAEMKRAVAEGPSPTLLKAQVCEALNGNVPAE